MYKINFFIIYRLFQGGPTFTRNQKSIEFLFKSQLCCNNQSSQRSHFPDWILVPCVGRKCLTEEVCDKTKVFARRREIKCLTNTSEDPGHRVRPALGMKLMRVMGRGKTP